ncbi:unnamed protein product [Ceutorhynchus assimilis]|uniref:Uncharacterized protein n=1 Tax=Ceutorhynchus assimilis TaxID=467358 RepID=A0A9N9MEE9_9CUCU|nr:unnamed protein product [Ceutorhynchus assimilis]
MLLEQQNIPLRGHRDDTHINLNIDDSENINSNDGNFKALLRFRVEAGDKQLEEHLKNAKLNATYISKTTCHSLIRCCGEEILKIILAHINAAISVFPCVTLTIDEDLVQVRENFVSVEPKISGKILGQTIILKLKSFGVGIGCDGCSVNISSVKGAAAEIQKVAKNAVLNSCFNHSLNLPISKCSKVKIIENTIGIIQELVSFFNASLKRN